MKKGIQIETKRKKNKGIHSKTKSSNQKNSKVYQKKYRGQGR